MIALTTTVAQTLAPGDAITFDKVLLRTGSCECCHNVRRESPTNSIKLRTNGIYEAYFSANVTGATADAQYALEMELGGQPLPETLMFSTPSAANQLNHITTKTPIVVCCGDYDRVTVVNAGANDIVVPAGALLYVKRVA